MSVDGLRTAMADRAALLLPVALERVEARRHAGHIWRTCPCSFCAIKREATDVIGSHTPRYRGVYISREGVRENWREEMRKIYRARLEREAGR